MPTDYYSILELSSRAAQEDIDAAYRRLALKYHPTVNASADAYQRMEQIYEAWDLLSDPARRRAYDASRPIVRLQLAEPEPAKILVVPQPQLLVQPRGEMALQRLLIPLPNLASASGMLWRIGIAVAVGLTVYFTVWAGQNRLLWIEGIIICAGLLTYSFFDARAGKLAWIGVAALSITGLAVLFIASPEVKLTSAPAAVAPPTLPKAAAAAIVPSPTSSPTATPDPGCPGGCIQPRLTCNIKGHAEPTGERIYYLRSDRVYDGVMMVPALADRWFCTEAEAQANGWIHYQEAPTSTPTPTLTPTVDLAAMPKMFVCSASANVRSGPGLERGVVGQADRGSSWLVLGKSGDWYHVQQGAVDQGYYIHQSLLCSDPKSPAALPTATPAAPAQGSDSPPAGPSGFKYQAPNLVGPASGTAYLCTRDLELRWSLDSAAPLADDEWFVVESRQSAHENWFGITDWTKDLFAVLHPNKGGGNCDVNWWPTPDSYEWRVVVVQGDIRLHALQKQLSPASASYMISYRR